MRHCFQQLSSNKGAMAMFLVCAWFVAAAWVCCQAHPRDVRWVTPNRYLRFHANDSYIGQPVPCTEREKLCFRFNTLLYETASGYAECYHVTTFRFVNRTELIRSGHLRAGEKDFSDDCFGNGGYRMAYDDLCYKQELVRGVICACGAEPGTKIYKNPTTVNLFGRQECRCDRTNRPHIIQPEEPGRCLIPNLNFPEAPYIPYTEEQGFLLSHYGLKAILQPVGFQCDVEQLNCFRRGQVAFGGSCVQLLKQGPCPVDHVVALDVTAAQKRHVETTCVHVRGNCPVGHLRLTFDGRCYSESELKIFQASHIVPNQFGQTILLIGYDSDSPEFIPQVFQDNLCHINTTLVLTIYGGYPAGNPASVPVSCAQSNDKTCKWHEVRLEPPEPDP